MKLVKMRRFRLICHGNTLQELREKSSDFLYNFVSLRCEFGWQFLPATQLRKGQQADASEEKGCGEVLIPVSGVLSMDDFGFPRHPVEFEVAVFHSSNLPQERGKSNDFLHKCWLFSQCPILGQQAGIMSDVDEIVKENRFMSALVLNPESSFQHLKRNAFVTQCHGPIVKRSEGFGEGIESGFLLPNLAGEVNKHGVVFSVSHSSILPQGRGKSSSNTENLQ